MPVCRSSAASVLGPSMADAARHLRCSLFLSHGASSVLSLDFGSLGDENMRLKKELVASQKRLRLASLVEEDAAYESDIPSRSFCGGK